MALTAGTPAPTFRYRDAAGQTYTNDDFLGKKGVVIAFYALAFTGG